MMLKATVVSQMTCRNLRASETCQRVSHIACTAPRGARVERCMGAKGARIGGLTGKMRGAPPGTRGCVRGRGRKSIYTGQRLVEIFCANLDVRVFWPRFSPA